MRLPCAQNSLGWIPGPNCDRLETCRQGEDSLQETGAHFHAQAHISTQSPQARENPWFPRPHEDQERRRRPQPPPRHRPQARGRQRRLPRLNPDPPICLRSSISPERVCATIARPAETPSGNAMSSSPSTDSRQARQPFPRRSFACVRLQKHADYQRAYAASRKRQSASMSWFLALQQPGPSGSFSDHRPAPPDGPRVGLTAGKVLGKAHERNRIKRRMREALRRHLDLLPDGCDLIFHPRRFILTVEFAKLEAEIVRILHQANAEAKRMTALPTAQPAPPAKPAL